MTAAQRHAADPSHSVWVSANAGSGKTRVLTDRVLRLLLQGVRPERILCLTYTKAAAAEMAVRLQQRLTEWVVKDDAALVESLRALLGEVPEAAQMARARRLFAEVVDAPDGGVHIQTLHSLCQSLLRRFALEAGVAPHFRLMEDQEGKVLRREVQEGLLLAAHHAAEEEPLRQALRHLALTISEYRFYGILNEILAQRSAFAALQETGGLEAFQEKLRILLGDDATCQTEDALFQQCFAYSVEELLILRQYVPTLYDAGKNDRKLAAAMELWLESPCMARVEDWLSAMLTQDNEPRKHASSAFITIAVRKRHPEIDEVMGREVARAHDYFLRRSTLRLAQMSTHLWHLAQAMLALYEAQKQKRALLDYEDLLQHTASLLHRPGIAPWVLFKLDGGVDHLLVDEAQDTSRLQWSIIEALATEFFTGESAAKAERTLFVVGDEKQSIYSFQGADPAAFGEMQEYFHAQKPIERVNLSLSFRSAEAVLRAVDAVFAVPETREGVVLHPSESVAHSAHRKALGRVEVWPLVTGEAEEERPAWSTPETQLLPRQPDRILAEKIAETLKGWFAAKRVSPGDVLILVQKRNRVFHALISELKRQGIPLAGADRLTLSEHLAVQDMLALAQFMLLPEDDLNLACLLKSPLIGLGEAQLYTLCAYREGSVWESVRAFYLSHRERSQSASDAGEGENNPHPSQASPSPTSPDGRGDYIDFSTAYTRLLGWLNKADTLPPFELFSQVLEAEGGRQRFVARMGEEVSDPLSEFLALALHYERLNPPSLQGFLHWFEQSDAEIKRDMEQARAEVRIMTVHGAKGLEAPIVFLPDTTTLPNIAENLVWSPDKSILLWSFDAKQDTDAIKALKELRKSQAMEEYRRLLYVALTRAADELYIAGVHAGKRAVSPDCWYSLICKGLEGTATKHETTDEYGEVHTGYVLGGEELSPLPLGEVGERSETGEGKISLPLWLHTPAPDEPTPPRPLTPSQPEGDEPASDLPAAETAIFLRGKQIHMLLEILPNLPAAQWRDAGALLLRQQGAAEALLEEVLAVLHDPQFAAVFATGSLAEVPITATIEKNGQPRILSGQIDRLVVTPTEVLVLDYKTNRQIPASAAEIAPRYRAQLESYALALQQIYPNHAIKTAILWTSAPRLMVIETPLL